MRKPAGPYRRGWPTPCRRPRQRAQRPDGKRRALEQGRCTHLLREDLVTWPQAPSPCNEASCSPQGHRVPLGAHAAPPAEPQGLGCRMNKGPFFPCPEVLLLLLVLLSHCRAVIHHPGLEGAFAGLPESLALVLAGALACSTVLGEPCLFQPREGKQTASDLTLCALPHAWSPPDTRPWVTAGLVRRDLPGVLTTPSESLPVADAESSLGLSGQRGGFIAEGPQPPTTAPRTPLNPSLLPLWPAFKGAVPPSASQTETSDRKWIWDPPNSHSNFLVPQTLFYSLNSFVEELEFRLHFQRDFWSALCLHAEPWA